MIAERFATSPQHDETMSAPFQFRIREDLVASPQTGVHAPSGTVESFISHYNLGFHRQRVGLYYPDLIPQLYNVPVVWSSHLQTSAGYASRTRGITLHPALQREGFAATVETFLHELAHLMAQHIYGGIDHGPHWQEMMYLLGQRPERLHHMDLRRKAETFDEAGL